MTTDFTLRLPEDIATLAAEEAARVGISRHEWLVGLITAAVTRSDFDPDIMIGFVQLECSEVDPEALCPTCGFPFGNEPVYVGFTAGHIRPEPFGPICHECVITTGD